MYQKIFRIMFVSLLTVLFLNACSGDVRLSTPDEVFDAIDGMSNHANVPDSDL